MGCNCKRASVCVLVAGGIVLIVFGGIWQGIQSKVVKHVINKEMVLKEGSLLYPKWQKYPMPILRQFYFYNWTNAEQWQYWLTTNTLPVGAKPSFTQIGPFTYKEYRTKEQIHQSPYNDTIFYKERRLYIFDPETSCDICQDDNTTDITMINIPLVAAMGLAQTVQFSLPSVIYSLFLTNLIHTHQYNYTIYFNPRVRDICFDGYTDSFIKTILQFKSIFPKYINLTDLLPNGKFSIYADNDTAEFDGEYSVYNGKGNAKLIGTFDLWKGSRQVPYWQKGSHCNDINGTDGLLHGPDVKKSDRLYMFTPDIYRSAYLVYQKEAHVNGIKTYRYVIDKTLLDYNISDNTCFCSPTLGCPPNAFIDASSVKANATVWASLAQCYMCDQKYIDQVEGMIPNEQDDETYLCVEPHTGVTFEAMLRIQFNLETRTILNVPMLKNLPQIVFPMLWMNMSAIINDELTHFFKTKALIWIELSEVLPYICYGLGVGSLLLALLIACCCCKEDNRKIY